MYVRRTAQQTQSLFCSSRTEVFPSRSSLFQFEVRAELVGDGLVWFLMMVERKNQKKNQKKKEKKRGCATDRGLQANRRKE